MTFISYAQNYEDVMLWRVLKGVENGFYIDVGAQDPEKDSVTKAFYDNGWNGINIEPVNEWHEKLVQFRPRDINLDLAASSETGELIFFEIPDTGLSTLDKETAERHKKESGYEYRERKVSVKTIAEICRENNVETIHFLKIDVEGAELEVIRGIDFSKNRPWIMLVETTLPNSQVESHYSWEQIVLDAGYFFAYFDGLNRFYVAQEHKRLLNHFNAPPNYFDNFIRAVEYQKGCHIKELNESINYWYSVAEDQSLQLKEKGSHIEELNESVNYWHSVTEKQGRQLKEQNRKLQEQGYLLQELGRQIEAQSSQLKEQQRLLQELNKTVDHWYSVADDLNSELQSVYNSKSWKVTLPLRIFIKGLKWFFKFPSRFLKKPAKLESPTNCNHVYDIETITNKLTPGARRVYAYLLAAYKDQGKEIY